MSGSLVNSRPDAKLSNGDAAFAIDQDHVARIGAAPAMLAIGCLALVLPLIWALCHSMWGTEEGAYGPLVAVTAIWLIVRMSPLSPGSVGTRGARAAWALIGLGLIGYVLCARTNMVGPGCVCAFLVLLSVYALHYGWAAARYAWFPFAYLLFAFPLPETITVPLGQMMKLHLSQAATDLLSALGMPVANSGVVIYVGQYELLVKTACSGLNSLIGLSAIGTFYGYVAHNGRIPLWFVPLIPATAIFCNFLRVLILVVATGWFGSAVVGTSFHDVVALGMYVVALLFMYLADHLFSRAGGRSPAVAR